MYEDTVFLHDEMYELLEEGVTSLDTRARQIGDIVSWYSEEINRIGSELKEARKSGTSLDVENLLQKVKDLQVEQLHYSLRKDVREGMAHFVERSLDAFFSWDVGWDAQLTGEVGDFLSREEDPLLHRSLEWEITLASVRWSIRLGDWEQAVALLQELDTQASPGSLHTAHREIWRARYYQQVSGLYGQTEQAFEQAHKNLSGVAISEEDRLKARLQALLYLQQGYSLRQQGKNQMAAIAYKSAIPLLRWLDNREALADVLKNQAFALAESGDAVEAKRLIQDATDLAEELGAIYMKGLCLNTRALIAIRAGDLEDALWPAQQALELFRDIKNTYGEGLATRALAEAYRRLALYHKDEPRKQREEIEKAQQWGERSVAIFAETPEIVRKIEAYIEAGCAYRDRIYIEREGGLSLDWLKRAPEVSKGREHLEKAVELAQTSLPYRAVEARVNLALLALYLDDFEECQNWLRNALDFVPPNYVIQKGEPYPPSGDEKSFWLALGKLYQVRANALLRERAGKPAQDDLGQIGEWITLAYAYNELFEPYSYGARRGKDDLYRVLKGQKMNVLQEFYRAVWKTAQKYGLPRSKENPQNRTMAIQFLESHLGPSDLYIGPEELEEYWEESIPLNS
jgi:tetratricopeptide (TPR) repeat protein